eukprot:8183176-Pyramimonas_sp.AAC.1
MWSPIPHVDASGRLFLFYAESEGDCRRQVGLHAAIKPLLSRTTTGELLNSPPKYFRTPKKRPS